MKPIRRSINRENGDAPAPRKESKAQEAPEEEEVVVVEAEVELTSDLSEELDEDSDGAE